ncbi:MAG: tRNA uridine-5-carboxymethylaminomethyl(34) synthesis GTPase MnmE [Elusimicrobia bacterium]|nr:tRNA uridine-5-carboxymethylaminomethyl(34) synthesis GTPase MnmE [Elusimicrobiota bacterium]
MTSLDDTIAAVATPWGEGGIGVVRVSGPEAVRVGERVFHSPSGVRLAEMTTHTCHVGMIQLCGEPVDQVVATVMREPRSYTGQDTVEFSGHGGMVPLRRILEACLQAGARLAEPGEFTLRAFVNGKMDLAQAEAVADVIRAKTDQALTAALHQLEGHLSEAIRRLRQDLLELLAHLEVGLDHSDEDHPFLDREALLHRCTEVQHALERLLGTTRTGRLYREGLKVAIVGKPNVGKSSLMNVLLREERAIVTPIPGTTRDVLEEGLNLRGIPLVILDTAGMRAHSQDPIEQLGMERTRRVLEQTEAVLFVLDTSVPLTEEDRRVAELLNGKPTIVVLNKADLPACWPPQALDALMQRSPSPPPSPTRGEGKTSRPPPSPPTGGRGKGEGGRRSIPAVRISTIRREGIDQLEEALWHSVMGGTIAPHDGVLVTNVRHQDALRRAQDALQRASTAASQEAFEECVALELRNALDALGEIIGATTTEDFLQAIFSTFCIGK